MSDEPTDPPDEESEKAARDRHWRELMERRKKRDERLAELEKEGLLAPSMVGDDDDGPKESVLARLREREGKGLTDVEAKQMEAEERAAARRRRGTRGLVLVVLLAVLGAVGYVMVGSSGGYQVTAEFTNASQLVGGEVVTIGGTPAGKVSKIELSDDGNALITFSVDEANAPLQRGTVAQIRSFSLSGVANRQIELTLPGEGQGTGEIEDGGTMDQTETISEVDLDQIFNTLNPKTAADFKKVIKGFARSYQGVAVEGNEGFKYLNPFLSTSRQTFAELTRDTPALEQLIVDGSQLSGALASRRDDISALIGNLNTMMTSIARQKTALAESINKLPPFMRDFNTTAVNLRAALDDVDPLVDASKPVAVRLRPFFANFRAASADLVPTVSDLDQIVSDPGPDNDLVDLTRLQPNLAKVAVGPLRDNGKRRQGSFPEGATALTDSLNELAMFRAYTPELTSWFNDFSGSSGVQDANGGITRIAVTFNSFSLATNDLPIVDLAGLLQTTGQDLFDIDNYQRCPGSNERPSPDGSNPFTDPNNPASAGGPVNCDPSIIPPGN